MLKIFHWSGKSRSDPDCEMEGSAGSCGDSDGDSAKKKRRPSLLTSFLSLFRRSDEDAGGRNKAKKIKDDGHYSAVGRWLGKTASLHRFQVPSSKSRPWSPVGFPEDQGRKREYPETPPRPPPHRVSTSPPRRRRRRNRSGSQFSLFSIGLEQRSRSMQSLLQGALAW